jgi:hypothetical protein
MALELADTVFAELRAILKKLPQKAQNVHRNYLCTSVFSVAKTSISLTQKRYALFDKTIYYPKKTLFAASVH